jgi:hypothetical protein
VTGADVGLAPPVVRARGRWREHRFFTAMAVALALTVFVGFAPTYYLAGLTGARPVSPLVHVHALVYTCWVLLFVAQSSLVAAGRVDLHRRLGLAAAVLVPVMLVVGWLTAVEAARRGVTPPGGPPPLAFLAVPLGTVVVFALFVGAGLANRRRPDTHRRLMLLATIVLLTPALARYRYYTGNNSPLVPILGTCAFVLVCVVRDRIARGRVHPAFAWGGAFLVLSLPARFALGTTGAWHSFAEWLVR